MRLLIIATTDVLGRQIMVKLFVIAAKPHHSPFKVPLKPMIKDTVTSEPDIQDTPSTSRYLNSPLLKAPVIKRPGN